MPLVSARRCSPGLATVIWVSVLAAQDLCRDYRDFLAWHGKEKVNGPIPKRTRIPAGSQGVSISVSSSDATSASKAWNLSGLKCAEVILTSEPDRQHWGGYGTLDAGIDGVWERPGRTGVVQCPMRPVPIEMGLILGQDFAQVRGVDDEHPVEDLAAHSACPAFHDRDHAR